MKGKRFTEEQITRILQQAEAGLTVVDVGRKHNGVELSFETLGSREGREQPKVVTLSDRRRCVTF